MKKKLIFKYFIFIFLFSFNQVIAEECDLEFEIGDDASKAIFLYGEPQDELDGKVKVDTGYTFIEEFFKFVCPGHGMEEAIIQILLSNDEISGYKINSYARKDDEDAKNILTEHEKKISNSKAEVKLMINKANEEAEKNVIQTNKDFHNLMC